MKTKKELRDKYFAECTQTLNGMKKVNMEAHDIFEWFWNNFQKLNQDEVSISVERARKYAAQQHYRGTINEPLVDFEDWEVKG